MQPKLSYIYLTVYKSSKSLCEKKLVLLLYSYTTVFFTLVGTMTQRHYGQTQKQANKHKKKMCLVWKLIKQQCPFYNSVFISFQ